MVDQIFDTEKFAENILYMPAFDVCAELSSIEAEVILFEQQIGHAEREPGGRRLR